MVRAFVSSTFRDLREHRAYVIERLERSGIFVDPMEKWTAAGDEPKDLSTARVKDCQLCVLLVGFRRGHVPKGAVQSITQMEYAEALRCGLEVLIFLANTEAGWPPEAIAALNDDPALVQWRSELMEHKVVGTFTPRPESIDVDAAVSRWLQKLAAHPRTEEQAADEGPATVDIRAYSNSEGALIVWRTDQRIDGCLGFALHRRTLEPGGIKEEVMTTFSSFPGAHPAAVGAPVASTQQPIQNFRWFDRARGEVRYRVVPVMGAPGNVVEAEDPRRGSAWTAWITPRTGQSSQCRAFFNGMHSPQMLARLFGRKPVAGETALVGRLRQGRSDLRDHLGGGLRRAVLVELLSVAKMADRRVYAALSDLDDPDVVTMIMNLRDNARVILAPDRVDRAQTGSRNHSHAQICRRLREASVHVYQRQRSGPGSVRSNFAVVCDHWGAPVSVWSGSAAWTVRALCLRPNNGILAESVPLARAYLDRWEYLLATRNGKAPRSDRGRSALAHVREHAASTTVWNSPVSGEADLRDASRLIRGARQGVLFLVNGRRFADTLMTDLLRLAGDKDLFIEGLSWSTGRGRGSVQYVHHLGETRHDLSLSSADPPIDSTIVLVDPFGPHPVVMTGSHDLSTETSARDHSDLLIVENVAGLAAEYAVHLLGLFDHYRMRYALAALAGKGALQRLHLQTSDEWQDRYFTGAKRREFNFLFGSLSPGLER
jgi:Domain of unknown function (DUF4062)